MKIKFTKIYILFLINLILITNNGTIYIINSAYSPSPNTNMMDSSSNDLNYNLELFSKFTNVSAVVNVEIIDTIAILSDEILGMLIINISDVSNPTLISNFQKNEASVFDAKYYDNCIFVAHGREGLVIVDISNITNPKEIGSLDNTGIVWTFEIVNNIAFVVDRVQGLEILNVSNKANPYVLSRYSGQPFDVQIENNFAYIAAGIGKGLEIIDITDLYNPIKVSQFSTGVEDAVSVTIKNGLAYLSSRKNGLNIISISNPYNLIFINKFKDSELGVTWEIMIHDGFAFIADESDGLEIIDINNPSKLYEIGQFKLKSAQTFGVNIKDEYIFVADYINGLEIVTWKIAQPNPVTDDYKIINTGTLSFTHNEGPFSFRGYLGNTTYGINLTLTFNLGLISPISFKIKAPINIKQNKSINLEISISSLESVFFANFEGSFSITTPLGTTNWIDINNLGDISSLELAAFQTFIGRNLSYDLNLDPIIIWYENITQYNLKLQMTPYFNITGSAVVAGYFNNSKEYYFLNWIYDSEKLLIPLVLPNEKRSYYNYTIEDLYFNFNDLKIDFHNLRFDLLAFDLIPIYTWYINYANLSTDILNILKNDLMTSWISDNFLVNERNANTLFYLNGNYILGDYSFLIKYTNEISMENWLYVIILVCTLFFVSLPWSIILLKTTHLRKNIVMEEYLKYN